MINSDENDPLFAVGEKKVEAFNLHINTIKAIKEYAAQKGTNASVLVGFILDQYLKGLVNRGKIPAPTPEKKAE